MKTYRNSRNETATTDGARWWSGSDTDETTVALNALQPVSTLFPGVDASVTKARAVFISCLRKAAPNVTPSSDAEREIFRKAWDDASSFSEGRVVVAAGRPLFDCKLMLVGTADAIVLGEDGICYTYCYSPEGYEWAGETNAIASILWRGLPVACEDDPHGHYTVCNLARAIQAIVTRHDTAWYLDNAMNTPF